MFSRHLLRLAGDQYSKGPGALDPKGPLLYKVTQTKRWIRSKLPDLIGHEAVYTDSPVVVRGIKVDTREIFDYLKKRFL